MLDQEFNQNNDFPVSAAPVMNTLVSKRYDGILSFFHLLCMCARVWVRSFRVWRNSSPFKPASNGFTLSTLGRILSFFHLLLYITFRPRRHMTTELSVLKMSEQVQVTKSSWIDALTLKRRSPDLFVSKPSNFLFSPATCSHWYQNCLHQKWFSQVSLHHPFALKRSRDSLSLSTPTTTGVGGNTL